MRRAARSSWARAASASGDSPPTRTSSSPAAIQLNRSPAWRHRAACGPVEHHHAARSQRREAVVKCRHAHPVVDDVRAALSGEPAHGIDHAVIGDHVVGARPRGQLGLGRAGCRRHHDAAEPLDHLGKQQPDAPGGGMHHRDGARGDWERAAAQVVRRQPLQDHRGGDFRRQSGRHRNGIGGADRDELGVAARRVPPGHDAAHCQVGDSGTDGYHGPGSLGARHERSRRGVRPDALPLVDVAEVHPGGSHSHDDLARPGHRVRAVSDRQHLRPAMPFHHHCTHGDHAPSPCPGLASQI